MSDWKSRDRKYVWHPFTQIQTAPEPIVVTRAKDTILYSEDGKEYLDCNSSWWVNVHGHGNEHIANAVAEQVIKLDHVIFAGVTHPKAIELSERVAELLPQQLQKVFFSDDGSTAVEVALKMAFQFWHNQDKPKNRILAMDGAYHGDTFGAMSVGQRGYFNEPFESFFFDVDFLSFPSKSNENELLEEAEMLFAKGEFAALIVEPLVQGSAGMRIYDASWLDKLVAIAQKHQVLVIFDEVMTAWGRTGKLFAMDHCVLKPDIVCLSKGLTGGVLPLGLTVATEQIFQAFLDREKSKAFLHGHSFTGNAIACAAACASLDIFEQEGTWQNIARIANFYQDKFSQFENHPAIESVRMIGTILAIDLKTGEGNTYFSSIRDQAYDFFLQNGLLMRPLGNVIFLNPPYCITDEQLHFSYLKILEFASSLDI
ncbi:MAG: adenosylmethionine--8-amino-7-oxononanoate transaminase [Flavobacteriia bacterium]